MKYVIAYDLGTGGIKTSIFDQNGSSVGYKFLSYPTYFDKEDFREQNPDDWYDAVKQTTKEVLKSTKINPNDIVSLAVSGHSLGVVPIGFDGSLLLSKVPIWNDARAKDIVDAFFEKTERNEWYLKTGNGFPAELYSIFKIMWYKENKPEVYNNTQKFIGTKDYINYKLTGRLVTDHSYASGSGVYSLEKSEYNDDYINFSGIDKNKLPDIIYSTDAVGKLTEAAANELGLTQNTVVCAGGVDNACMALGAGCINSGDVYTSLGTSAWIAVCDGKPIVDTKYKPYVFAHCIPNKYVSATAIFSAGNSLSWVKNQLFSDLCEKEKNREIKSAYEEIDRLADLSPIGANKLLFVPTLAGGSSLDKSANARGSFVGLDLMHTRNDIARATLEGIALNLSLALKVLKKYARIDKNMLIVGGGANSKIWKQIFADTYKLNIVTSKVAQDAGSFGAAIVACVGAGIWHGFDDVKKYCLPENNTAPNSENVKKYKEIYKKYKKILDYQSDIGDMLKEINL